MNPFDSTLHTHGIALQRAAPRVLQVNVGKKCNQTCVHCHVNAGPGRTEIMTLETAEAILQWLAQTEIAVVDVTGGAPELNPHFRHLVESVRTLGRHVIDRCNLTVFYEDGQDDLPNFLASHEVEVVASLPCYDVENVDEQRGLGVFEKSIGALQTLNALGYGRDGVRRLNLVYNPNGAFLPPPQSDLEAAYRVQLKTRFGIDFNDLYTITNMPIARYAAYLRRSGEWDDYHQLLVSNFNPAAVGGLMCRDTLNIGWRGQVFDCDFNQMLHLDWRDADNASLKLWDIDLARIGERAIRTGNHCFGCTAGSGSSCGGALL